MYGHKLSFQFHLVMGLANSMHICSVNITFARHELSSSAFLCRADSTLENFLTWILMDVILKFVQ